MGFATIDPPLFMKVHFSIMHLFIWTKNPFFYFLKKLKLKDRMKEFVLFLLKKGTRLQLMAERERDDTP